MTPAILTFLIMICQGPVICKVQPQIVKDNVCSVVVTRYEPTQPPTFKDRLVISQVPCFKKETI